MSYILRATDTGAIVINGNPYQRGSLRVFPYKQVGVEYAELLIEDAFGNVIVPAAPFGDFETDGDAFASGPDLKDFVEANFFKIATAGAGSGGGFSALSGTELNGGNKFVTLTANTALTIKPGVNNSFRVYVVQDGTGNRTLSIAGQALTISTAAGSDTLIEADVVNGNYVFSINTSPVAVAIPVPDTTAPTIVSVEAIDANHIRIVFSEAVSGSHSGFAFTANAAGLTITGDTGDGTNTKTYTITETMADSDVLAYAYVKASGDTEDTSGNKLESASGSVVNSVPAPSTGYTILSNASLGTSSLDTSKWSISDPNGTGATIDSVVNGVITISGGNNGAAHVYNVVNTEYPFTMLGSWRSRNTITVGTTDPGVTGEIRGQGITIIGHTSASRDTLYIQTSGFTGTPGAGFGSFGIINSALNGYKFGGIFPSLTTGETIDITIDYHWGLYTFTADRFTALGGHIDTISFTFETSVFNGSARMSWYGCILAIAHLGGAGHSSTTPVWDTDIQPNGTAMVMDSIADSFPSAAANSTQNLLRQAHPSANIYTVSAGGYQAAQFATDTHAQSEVARFAPAQVIIALGTNDAVANATGTTIANALSTAAAALRTAAPSILRVFFRSVLPITGPVQDNIPAINTDISTMISGLGAGNTYVDIFTRLKASGSNALDPSKTADGGEHPNDAGMADMFTDLDAAVGAYL